MAFQQSFKERGVQTGRRLPGTGRLMIRTARDGSQTWYGSWYAGGRRLKRKVGPRRRRGHSTGLTEHQAEDMLRRMIVESDVERPVGDAMTINELLARFLKDRERRGRKKSTRLNADGHTRTHIAPYFGTRPIQEITTWDVTDFVGHLEAKDLAPKTVHNVIATLRAMLNYAKAPQRRWVLSNPVDGVELPAVPEPQEIRYLTLPEIQRLLDHVRPGMFHEIDHGLYHAAVTTGMRLGELVALRWRDVDWNAGRIRVRRNYTCGEFGTPKTRRSTRSIPMIPDLAATLRAHHQRTRWPGPDDLVFAYPITGDVLPKANITRRMALTCRAAGITEHHRFHDLRHTFGTHMAAAGVPLRTLQEWMGHRDLTTTQRFADYAPSEREGEMVAAAFGVVARA